jgi:predicted SAM-dependent methyltransferase
MERMCNVCGGSEFGDQGSRKGVRCLQCGSLERTRVMQLMLFEPPLVAPGARVLHLAPEVGIANNIKKLVGAGYEAYDLFPEKFRKLDVRKMDLVTDAETLPSNHYDLVLHSHVLEHLPCDVTSVLFHLHRSLRPTGFHVFSVPLRGGYYEADLGKLTPEERLRRFGQNDHVRMFGVRDIGVTLGMVFRLPAEYDLEARFPADRLEKYNIPANVRKGFNSSSIFVMRKDDIRLRSQ